MLDILETQLFHVLLTNLLLLPAVAALTLGTHLLTAGFPGVPLAAYGSLLFAPYVTLQIYERIGQPIPSLLLAVLSITLAGAALYWWWQRVADRMSLSSEQKLLCELLAQTSLIALCSLAYGPATYVFPPAFLLGTNPLPFIAGEQWAAFLFGLILGAVLLPACIVVGRYQRLLVLSEDRAIAGRLGLASAGFLGSLALISFFAISGSGFLFALDHGFNINSMFSPFIYCLSIALLVQAGNYAALVGAVFAFFLLRSLSILAIGSWTDDVLALLLIAIAVLLVYRRNQIA